MTWPSSLRTCHFHLKVRGIQGASQHSLGPSSTEQSYWNPSKGGLISRSTLNRKFARGLHGPTKSHYWGRSIDRLADRFDSADGNKSLQFRPVFAWQDKPFPAWSFAGQCLPRGERIVECHKATRLAVPNFYNLGNLLRQNAPGRRSAPRIPDKADSRGTRVRNKAENGKPGSIILCLFRFIYLPDKD